MKQVLAMCLWLITIPLFAQQNFPVNGVHDERPGVFAFTNATIHIDYNRVIDNGVLIIEEGKVAAVGERVQIPSNAIVFNMKGKHICPSFIDLYSDYGMPPVEKPEKKKGPRFQSEKRGPFSWNAAVKPEMVASDHFQPDKKAAKKYMESGFGIVLTQQQDGIVRGTGTLVDLTDRNANKCIIKPSVSVGYSFDKGESPQNYPSSLMGSIALIRQTLYNAEWYDQSKHLAETAYNASLDRMAEIRNLPSIFDVSDKLSVLRAGQISREFGMPFIIKGNGDEYQELEAIKGMSLPMILPLTFPKPFDVSDPFAMQYVPWTDLKHWEMAPFNPRILAENSIEFAFTCDGSKKPQNFLKNLRKSVELGLNDSTALKALTITPAKLMGMEKMLGSLETGKWANFFITTEPIFQKECVILENWSRGEQFILNTALDADKIGKYNLFLNSDTLTFSLTQKNNSFHFEDLNPDSLYSKSSISFDDEVVNFSFQQQVDSTSSQLLLFTGMTNDTSWSGQYQDSTGNFYKWKAHKVGDLSQKSGKSKTPDPPEIPFFQKKPFQSYGFDSLPEKEKFLITNATVWTNENQGIQQNADVLVEDGIIVGVGRDLDTANAIIIDASGKHLTSGIIDEHSHMAISRGVNEGTQASSAEVRIGDVINNSDVNIYRQLAGGVTCSQLLHGSANPIGGQSALIKLRWGWNPEQMKFDNAAPFIKFALGENVKQSNWGDEHTVRYPQTRMGVEQIYYDRFFRAQDYMDKWDEFNKLTKKEQEGILPPRKDLELEALAEVLNGERFITCHSYIQSEINMLMHVADSFDFTVNTFTHILEGYKVADKMETHGAGGSTFSDWWAYKYEVIDAIPYNASIMNRVGVTTAINSDSREMARRLNQEAAKTMKYGGLSEEEAWKMVTLNPAKLLQIDHRVGSIKVGKDADLVIWSDHPLSIYARAEKTFVDGRLMYDYLRDEDIRDWIRQDRQRLIQMMAKEDGKKKKPEMKQAPEYHCEDVIDVFNTENP